jgi:hypothetical protein
MSENTRNASSLIVLTIGLFVVSFLLARYPAVAHENAPVVTGSGPTAPTAHR